MASIDDVAQRQHGLVTRAQVVGVHGITWLRRAVADRQLIAVGTGVFRCAGSTSTFRQRAMAACLAYGPPVAASHRSAGLLWGYEPVDPGGEIEVSIPRLRSGRRAGIRAHRVEIPDVDVVRQHGIPVTSPGRTLLDLAGCLPPSVFERCLDDALRARQATASELREWLSGQERRGCPAEKVAIEFNGWEFHQMRSRLDADHARTTGLELHGWIVIVVTAAHGEAETVERIRRALTMRRAAAAVRSELAAHAP